jgi:glutamate synthase domain-containing protein 2
MMSGSIIKTCLVGVATRQRQKCRTCYRRTGHGYLPATAVVAIETRATIDEAGYGSHRALSEHEWVFRRVGPELSVERVV